MFVFMITQEGLNGFPSNLPGMWTLASEKGIRFLGHEVKGFRAQKVIVAEIVIT